MQQAKREIRAHYRFTLDLGHGNCQSMFFSIGTRRRKNGAKLEAIMSILNFSSKVQSSRLDLHLPNWSFERTEIIWAHRLIVIALPRRISAHAYGAHYVDSKLMSFESYR